MKNSVCICTFEANFFPNSSVCLAVWAVCTRSWTHTNLLLTFGLSAFVLGIFGYMYVHARSSAPHGKLWFWTACNSLSSLRQTALPPVWIRDKLHHGYALAMVTLPKRCCGSVLSPWLRTNPPSVVRSQQLCPLRETFSRGLGVLTTCLCCRYWTRWRGWVCFRSLSGQRRVPAPVPSSYSLWFLTLGSHF